MVEQKLVVKIEKFVPSGKSLAHLEDGKAVFIWGGLPGEEVEIELYKNKKNFAEARLVRVVKASSARIQPTEEHYLICSPWQALSYSDQIVYKRELLQEIFKGVPISDFVESQQKYNYRTKLEFSFTPDEQGKIRLAFHVRGANNKYEIVNGCELGSNKINRAALKITEELNKIEGVEAKGLKSLTIRESKTSGKIIAILAHKFREYQITLPLASLDGLVDGVVVAYSTIKSPISVLTEIRYQEGLEYLEEEVLQAKIRYPYDGFFQNNLPTFIDALEKIRDFTKKSDKITEIYSGSGSIGFNLVDKAKKLVGIEIVPSAVKYAKINQELNGITNYFEIEKSDNKIVAEDIAGSNIVVLDPPRSGLHPKLVKRLIETLPERIIYLSCNPVTQARDYDLLKEDYSLISLTGYDFYPNTPHMESLIILDRIDNGLRSKS